jgi:hypothetical protein
MVSTPDASMATWIRTATLDKFRAGEITVLAASDVAARGLDIPEVSHVFNFDIPWQADDYVHRIGRTGRAGREGFSASIVTGDDFKALAEIAKITGEQPVWMNEAPTEAEFAVPHHAARQRHAAVTIVVAVSAAPVNGATGVIVRAGIVPHVANSPHVTTTPNAPRQRLWKPKTRVRHRDVKSAHPTSVHPTSVHPRPVHPRPVHPRPVHPRPVHQESVVHAPRVIVAFAATPTRNPTFQLPVQIQVNSSAQIAKREQSVKHELLANHIQIADRAQSVTMVQNDPRVRNSRNARLVKSVHHVPNVHRFVTRLQASAVAKATPRNVPRRVLRNAASNVHRVRISRSDQRGQSVRPSLIGQPSLRVQIATNSVHAATTVLATMTMLAATVTSALPITYRPS